MKNYFLVWIVILLLSSCGQLDATPSPTNSNAKKTEGETMSEIYARAIKYYRQGDSVRFCLEDVLRISSLTGSYAGLTVDNREDIIRQLPQLQQETWYDFLRVQSQQVSFPSDLALGHQYVLIDDEPDSNCYYTFSQIAFNNNRDQALVILTVQDDSFHAGTMYLLNLIDGQWEYVEELLLYIS